MIAMLVDISIEKDILDKIVNYTKRVNGINDDLPKNFEGKFNESISSNISQ